MCAVTIAYRVLPPKAPSWRSILPPAILVGIAITLLTQLFTALVPFLVGAAAIAGSLASAFVALAWLSFSFQALLYGASWVRVAELRAAAGDAPGRLTGAAVRAGSGRFRSAGRSGPSMTARARS